MADAEENGGTAPAPPAPVPPVVARIAKIALADYRAFPAGWAEQFDLGAEGKNLLLYGENGSGKTSLFRALKDLMSSFPSESEFAPLRHIYAPGEDGFVSVQLTAGTPNEFRWEYGEKHPRETGGHPYSNFSERCRFLDYKALLETNFVHREPTPNLFSVLVGDKDSSGILCDLPVLVDGKSERLGVLYRRMLAAPKGDRLGRRKHERTLKACKDFSDALANHLPEVVSECQGVIGRLSTEGLKFDLKPSVVSYKDKKFIGREIRLEVNLYDKPITQPQMFLNEARLTALALAIYLGAAKLVLKPSPADKSVPTRLLVLDDVLIGLDLSNRLPVLRLLEEVFSDWQIILMTYDRVWFELAKEFTEHSGRWMALNLREVPTVPGQPGRPHVDSCPDLLAVAEKHMRDSDLMATAVYVRAAFENRLKNVCRDHGIKINYKPDIKDIKADHLWTGITDRQKGRKADGKPDFIDPALMADIETVRSTVLNRLSHSGVPSLVTKEVQFALDTVKKFRDHKFKDLKHAGP